MYNPLKGILYQFTSILEKFDLIDRDRGRHAIDLSWPRMVTGLTRKSQQTADVAMLGFAIGPTAIAGLAFATIYWRIGRSLTSGLTGGMLAQVSQRFGANRQQAIDLAVKQSIWIGVLIALPITSVYWLYPEFLINIFEAEESALLYGTKYLQYIGLAFIPHHLNRVGSRALGGADNTLLPMKIRSISAAVNIILNIILIFGLGLGVVGAAIGTFFAEIISTILFAIGLIHGRLLYIGKFPINISTMPPYIDIQLSSELIQISVPNMLRRLGQEGAGFWVLIIIAPFSPIIISAYEVAKRVRGLMSTPGWGFTMSASSLVGQTLGEGNEIEAEAYGWDILSLSIAVYSVNCLIAILFPEQIAQLFVQGKENIAHTKPFIRVVAISLLGMGIDRAMSGSLKGAGDTRWPMYGRFIGLYLFMIPFAYLGTTSLGIMGLYIAMTVETYVPAFICLGRFWTGQWKLVSRKYRPDVT